MTTKYVVSLISEYGNQKTVAIDANNCEEARIAISNKYPSHEIVRITQQKLEVDYFNAVKSMKKNG